MGFTYDALNHGEIRLLKPVRSSSEKLSYKLIHTKIGTKLSYSAISYTWGESESTESIQINNEYFPIRPNLRDALEQIYAHSQSRKTSKSIDEYLWIDAICINQAKDGEEAKNERSSQIRMMRRIYEEADHVVVWLGKPKNEINNRLAFQKMAYFTKQYRAVQMENRPYYPWWAKHKPTTQQDDFFGFLVKTASKGTIDKAIFDQDEKSETYKAWLGICAIWKSRWWTRTWVYQEATIPERYTNRYMAGVTIVKSDFKVNFVYGDQQATWQDFSILQIVADHLQTNPNIRTGFMQGLQQPCRLLFQFRSLRIQHMLPSTLQILQHFRRTECGDLRDKVWAPLCLVPENATPKIVPDYERKSILEVYLDVVNFSLAQARQELDFLGYATWVEQEMRHISPTNGNFYCPSWVPNWFQPIDVAPIPKMLYLSKKPPPKGFAPYDRRGIPKNDEEQVRSFDTSAGALCTARMAGRNLHVQGIFCDVIEDFIPKTGPNVVAVAREKGSKWGKASGNKYPSGIQTFAEAMSHCSVMDLKYDWQGRACERGGIYDSEIVNKSRNELNAKEYEVQFRMKTASITATKQRQLCLTKMGYLAMAPASVVVGDKIYAFLGGQVLYVVRGLRYIGEAYVQGLMDGEVMKWVTDGRAEMEDLVLI